MYSIKIGQNEYDVPRHHRITFNGRYLKLWYEDLYLSGDTVFGNFDKVSTVDIKKFKLNEEDIEKIVVRFISNAYERNRTRPYIIKTLEDIDNIDYKNIWDFQYSDEGLKDRWLNGEGRCDY